MSYQSEVSLMTNAGVHLVEGSQPIVFDDRDPFLEDTVLKTVQEYLSEFQAPKRIIYQDYLGVGARLRAAQLAGLLPEDIILRVKHIGTLLYRGEVTAENLRRAYLEKMSIRYADEWHFDPSVESIEYANLGYEFPGTYCKVSSAPSEFDVVVPLYDPRISWVLELCNALNTQTLKPNRIWFIDDGSDSIISKNIQHTLETYLQVNYSYMVLPSNRGPAQARNVALHLTDKPYLISIDVDNVPKPDNFDRLVKTISKHPKAAAVTSYNEDFADVCKIYKPLGTGKLLAFGDMNPYGDNHGIYNVEKLKQVKGWPMHSAAEDMCLYMDLVSRGYEVLVIPIADYKYRNNPNGRYNSQNKQQLKDSVLNHIDELNIFDKQCLSQILEVGGKV